MPDERPSIYWNYEPKAQWKALARYVQEQLHDIEVIVTESKEILAKLPPGDPNQYGYVTGNPERKVRRCSRRSKSTKPDAGGLGPTLPGRKRIRRPPWAAVATGGRGALLGLGQLH